MGTLNRYCSAHQAYMKGKGIKYDTDEDDDDVPIKLVDCEDSSVIKEFGLTLIGKILNPNKQVVEKILQTMPSQWGLEERITATDIRNEKFLFNFMSEEDLNTVLRQGPFHYNFCMFIFVRWEPIVYDDYLWIIPFWVELIGFPLHLWTDANLRNISGRLGHVDTLELTEGRMLIDINSRKPLKFKRKVEYKRDEVTIEIKYTKLFKHCTSCGMLSHEKSYCPVTNVRSRLQERSDVFTRMTLPSEEAPRQHLIRNAAAKERHAYQPLLKHEELPLSQTNSYGTRGNGRSQYRDSRFDTKEQRFAAREMIYPKWEDDRRRSSQQITHKDKIIRRRDEYQRGSRYDRHRHGSGPYDHQNKIRHPYSCAQPSSHHCN